MKLSEVFSIWRVISQAYEISITQNEEINFYDKEKKLLLTLPVSIFEKFRKVSGVKNVI
ncbi:hypothetical protein [Psychrilyobacter atlanticus]|uniref:hypothetical protein n=1 Tax=Psychrilyobacter atlanticus TaxID=271091 RepID=UPI0004041454|nr:hypothetical protein [Psychrilyobacter atlanticus]